MVGFGPVGRSYHGGGFCYGNLPPPGERRSSTGSRCNNLRCGIGPDSGGQQRARCEDGDSGFSGSGIDVRAGSLLPRALKKFSVPGSQFSVKNRTFCLFAGHSVCSGRSFTICSGGAMGRSYRELIAWQKAMKLVTEIYAVTQRFPSEERYGLTNQLRRAAVSVPSNIAEGQARFSQKEFHHFLSQARGSLVEIETQLLIAKDLKYTAPAKAQELLVRADELGRILNGLISSIKTRAA